MAIVIQRSYLMATTVKPTNLTISAAIAAYLANATVTIAPAAVAQGLRKTRYIARVTKKIAKGA
jgi:hypothetical protein